MVYDLKEVLGAILLCLHAVCGCKLCKHKPNTTVSTNNSSNSTHSHSNHNNNNSNGISDKTRDMIFFAIIVVIVPVLIGVIGCLIYRYKKEKKMKEVLQYTPLGDGHKSNRRNSNTNDGQITNIWYPNKNSTHSKDSKHYKHNDSTHSNHSNHSNHSKHRKHGKYSKHGKHGSHGIEMFDDIHSSAMYKYSYGDAYKEAKLTIGTESPNAHGNGNGNGNKSGDEPESPSNEEMWGQYSPSSRREEGCHLADTEVPTKAGLAGTTTGKEKTKGKGKGTQKGTQKGSELTQTQTQTEIEIKKPTGLKMGESSVPMSERGSNSNSNLGTPTAP